MYAPIVSLAERFLPVVDKEVFKGEFEVPAYGGHRDQHGRRCYWGVIMKIKMTVGQMR